MSTLLRLASVTLALAALVPAGARAAPPPAGGGAAPSALDLVPADVLLFLHVRVHDLYEGPLGRAVRAAVVKEAADAEAEVEQGTGVALADLDTVTYVVPRLEKSGPPLVVLFTTRRPYDPAKVLAAHRVTGKEQTGPGLVLYRTAAGDLLALLGDRCFVVVSGLSANDAAALVLRLAETAVRVPAAGPLRSALDRAAGSGVVAGGLDVRSLAPAPGSEFPPELRPLLPLLKAESVALTLDLGDAATLDLRARFGTAAAALEGDKAIRDGRKLLLVLLAGMAQAVPRPAPDTLRWLNDAKAAVERAQIRWAGAEVQARLTVPGVTARAPAFAALAAQSVKRARSLGTRVAAADNLKQIGRALHDYHEAFGALPGAAIYSADGKTPLLSWRVAILPYLGQEELFKQFHLDEPWDSEHNQKLIEQMPKVYLAPHAPPLPDRGGTYFRVFVGGGALFANGPLGPRFADVRDGLATTLMVVEATDAVPWTQPDELVYDPDKPLPQLGADPRGEHFLALLADGAVRPVRRDLGAKTLRALITRAGGETVKSDDF